MFNLALKQEPILTNQSYSETLKAINSKNSNIENEAKILLEEVKKQYSLGVGSSDLYKNIFVKPLIEKYDKILSDYFNIPIKHVYSRNKYNSKLPNELKELTIDAIFKSNKVNKVSGILSEASDETPTIKDGKVTKYPDGYVIYIESDFIDMIYQKDFTFESLVKLSIITIESCLKDLEDSNSILTYGSDIISSINKNGLEHTYIHKLHGIPDDIENTSKVMRPVKFVTLMAENISHEFIKYRGSEASSLYKGASDIPIVDRIKSILMLILIIVVVLTVLTANIPLLSVAISTIYYLAVIAILIKVFTYLSDLIKTALGIPSKDDDKESILSNFLSKDDEVVYNRHGIVKKDKGSKLINNFIKKNKSIISSVDTFTKYSNKEETPTTLVDKIIKNSKEK